MPEFSSGVLVRASGRITLICSCNRWTAAASTLDELNRQAASHDDSPWQRHVVRVWPVAFWPKDEAEFAALIASASDASQPAASGTYGTEAAGKGDPAAVDGGAA